MADTPTSAAPTDFEGRPLSRRAVIRTAAHAAWMVPVIQAVSAAPAFAASGTTISVSANVTSWSSTALSATFQLQVTVSNTGGIAAAGVVITLVFPSKWNPTTSTPPGWTPVITTPGTVAYTAGAALPLGDTSFTVTLNPANSVVGRGSYIASGGGLRVAATAANAPTVDTWTDLAGAYANLTITVGSATWSRTGNQYFLTTSGTVTNRGRTATSNLRITIAYSSLGTATGSATGLADGWTFRSTYYERTGAELPPGSSAAFTATRQMTGGQAGTSGTVTLRPSDATLTNEVVTPLAIPVSAFA